MSTSPAPQPENPIILNFKIDNGLESWNVPAKEWLTKHQREWYHLVAGCVVFNPVGKVLLVQRASHDFMPDKWEIPGGSVDNEDVTILAGAARELWEEAGLVATRFAYVVPEGPEQDPGQLWVTSGTTVWCRFSFVAEVEDWENVRLDPDEHQDFLWATMEEVRAQRVGDREVPITTSAMSSVILEAFRLREEKAKRV